MMSQKHREEEQVIRTATTTTAVAEKEEKEVEEKEARKYLSLRSAAIKVLSGAPTEGMRPREIYAAAVARELVDPIRKGKTPEATLSAAFYTEIKNKKGDSTFVKVSKGHFALNPSIVNPKVVVDDDHPEEEGGGGANGDDGAPVEKKQNKKSSREPTRFFQSPKRLAPLSPNTHPRGKVICGFRKKGDGNQICRIPWTGEKHEWEHKFEPFFFSPLFLKRIL